jgi:hypothetical protein
LSAQIEDVFEIILFEDKAVGIVLTAFLMDVNGCEIDPLMIKSIKSEMEITGYDRKRYSHCEIKISVVMDSSYCVGIYTPDI